MRAGLLCVTFSLIVLSSTSQPACATSVLQFSLSNATFDYLEGDGLWIQNMDFEEDYSVMQVDFYNGDPRQLQDSALLASSGQPHLFQAFDTRLSFVQNGPNQWSAAGSMSFVDNSGLTIFQADFESTKVWLSGNSTTGFKFGITGHLNPIEGQQTMLVNNGSPWIFAGNEAPSLGAPDANGDPLSLEAFPQEWFEAGRATFLLDLPAQDWDFLIDLDDMLSYSFYQEGGSVQGFAAVPEPLTLIGFAAIAVLPAYLRRRAKDASI